MRHRPFVWVASVSAPTDNNRRTRFVTTSVSISTKLPCFCQNLSKTISQYGHNTKTKAMIVRAWRHFPATIERFWPYSVTNHSCSDGVVGANLTELGWGWIDLEKRHEAAVDRSRRTRRASKRRFRAQGRTVSHSLEVAKMEAINRVRIFLLLPRITSLGLSLSIVTLCRGIRAGLCRTREIQEEFGRRIWTKS